MTNFEKIKQSMSVNSVLPIDNLRSKLGLPPLAKKQEEKAYNPGQDAIQKLNRWLESEVEE